MSTEIDNTYLTEDEYEGFCRDLRNYKVSGLWLELNPYLDYVHNQIVCFVYGKPLIVISKNGDKLTDITTIKEYVYSLLNAR